MSTVRKFSIAINISPILKNLAFNMPLQLVFFVWKPIFYIKTVSWVIVIIDCYKLKMQVSDLASGLILLFL